MNPARKITVIVPQKLLDKAVKATGQGITPTIRQGLEILAKSSVYDEIRKLRGKVKFSLDFDKLRAEEE